MPPAFREAPEVPVQRTSPAVATLFVALLPACVAPAGPLAEPPLPPRARLALSPFVDETPQGAGPLAEGLALLLREALAREPRFQLTFPPGEQADVLLRGTILDFRPAAGPDPPILVTELGLVDARNGALMISRIVTGTGQGPPTEGAALPGSLERWAGTSTERVLRAWLPSALAALQDGVPAGYFIYDAAGTPVAPLPPPPARAGQRSVAPDVLPGTLAPTATVRAEGANLREGPGARFPVLGRLKRGEAVQLLDERGEWSNVRAPDGTEGWVFRDLLTEPRVPIPGGASEGNP